VSSWPIRVVRANLWRMEAWPALPLEQWEDTRATLHMWTQIVGKVRLEQTPLVNHYWNVPLYVSARGLTTTAMPYEDRFFEMEFDFVDHYLVIRCSDGASANVVLEPKSVAIFYQQTMAALHSLGMEITIWKTPVEIPDPIPFDEDEQHASYDRAFVERCWQVLRSSERILQDFRSRFIGKCSPVHFFWGSFDLAVTRFSGRPAPPRPDADVITREAYSHEVISHGWWPGRVRWGNLRSTPTLLRRRTVSAKRRFDRTRRSTARICLSFYCCMTMCGTHRIRKMR